MEASDLTDLQRQILKMVYDDEGRTPTESIYDLVEEARPTIDDDGEPIDDQDPYETSREELGALERGGLLASDSNTSWVAGATVFTDAGRALADDLFGPEQNPEEGMGTGAFVGLLTGVLAGAALVGSGAIFLATRKEGFHRGYVWRVHLAQKGRVWEAQVIPPGGVWELAGTVSRGAGRQRAVDLAVSTINARS